MVARPSNRNKILVQVLDTSGSMAGMPMESLKQGAGMILNAVLNTDSPSFEKLITITFNSDAYDFTCTNKKDLDGMQKIIQQLDAGGGTNFDGVFVKLFDMINRLPPETEFTVIFFTDGQDSNSVPTYLEQRLHAMKKQLS